MASRLKIKAQVMMDETIALGPGKADLLARIATTGSIAGAGRTLGLSYRRTRDMIDTLNACWAAPLVVTRKGGQAHGGASLTPLGQDVLAAYRTLCEAIDQVAAAHERALLTLLAPHPVGDGGEGG